MTRCFCLMPDAFALCFLKNNPFFFFFLTTEQNSPVEFQWPQLFFLHTKKKVSCYFIPLHPNIWYYILFSVLFIFPMGLTRRICFTIRSFLNWWSFPLFSWPLHLIWGWCCKEKSEANHSKELKGYIIPLPLHYSIKILCFMVNPFNKETPLC